MVRTTTADEVAASLLLLLAVWTVGSAAGTEQVESRPIDGHQFAEGQAFRFVCRAVGSQDFAVRLLCPLSDHAPGPMKSAACYENCGRPLCNQPALNDCSETMPELLDSGCTRHVRQLSGDIQEVTVEYVFRAASVRNSGAYACQYKNMRSSVHISVSATTTSTTTTSSTSTASTTTATTATSTRPSTSAGSTAMAAATARTAVQPAAKATTIAVVTTTSSPAASGLHPVVKNSNGSPGATPAEAEGGSTDGSDGEVPLKSGWFYSSIVGKLIGVDLVLIVLLAALAVVLICGFLFIRCQVSARQKTANTAAQATATKRPLQTCCSTLLCLGDAGSGDGGGGSGGRGGEAKSVRNGHSAAARLPRAERPPLQAFPNSDAASGQVYSEANMDSSYYSQGESDRLAGAGGPTDEYYRLQTHFDEAEEANSRLMVGGSQRGPRAGASGFFSRDAPDRHSFHNVRASRQRPAIPAELLVRAAPAGAEPSGGEIREQVEQQRREIEHLRQQLHDSQKQLSRLANSQQDLHRSVSVSRMAAGATRGGAAPGASAATTPDEPTACDDYELLSKAVTPTGELPSFSGGSVTAAAAADNAGLRGSADLLLSIDEPIEEEDADSDHVEYPTVRSKRRSSIGEAYGSGRMCPA